MEIVFIKGEHEYSPGVFDIKEIIRLEEYKGKTDIPEVIIKDIDEELLVVYGCYNRVVFLSDIKDVRIKTESESTGDTAKRLWYIVRLERDEKLFKSDWTQLPDCPLSKEKILEWKTYRQQLRNITNQDVFKIVWPEEPK